MPYELTFQPKPTYLHAIVTGTLSREDVAAYLEEVRAACATGGHRALLIEERLEGPRLSPLDVFEVVSAISQRDLGVLRAIAYVDVTAPTVQRFAETVAVNRGVPLAIFATVPDAESWLRKQAALYGESAKAPNESPH